MKQTITTREFIKEQDFNIAINLTLIISILLIYTGVVEKGFKFLVIGFFILLACLLIVKLINKLFLKINLFKEVLEEKSKNKYVKLIEWSFRILLLIIIWES